MSFESALRTRLKDDATISGIAGANIYWSARKQGSPFPAVVLTTIYGERPQHFGGFSDNIKRSNIQIACYATSVTVAQALREAVFAAIVPEATVGGVTFQRAFPEYRSRVQNTETTEVFQEIIEAEFRHN